MGFTSTAVVEGACGAVDIRIGCGIYGDPGGRLRGGWRGDGLLVADLVHVRLR